MMTYQEWFIMSYYDNVCFDSGCMGRIDNIGMPTATWDA